MSGLVSKLETLRQNLLTHLLRLARMKVVVEEVHRRIGRKRDLVNQVPGLLVVQERAGDLLLGSNRDGGAEPITVATIRRQRVKMTCPVVLTSYLMVLALSGIRACVMWVMLVIT